jgi:hypothetical protein
MLDEVLVSAMGQQVMLTPHSSTTSIPRAVVEAISFFEKLPSIPLHATPHGLPRAGRDADSPGWVLGPSTCYHTFCLLAGKNAGGDLKAFTSAAQCHRFEPDEGEFTRLGNFIMREFVLVGEQSRVEEMAERLLQTAVRLLRRFGSGVRTEKASDVFYGERSEATRKVQLALGVKVEILLPSPGGGFVSVASRNFHRELFTTNFRIGPTAPVRMQSACVAFGLERLLLLLAQTRDHNPLDLLPKLEEALGR